MTYDERRNREACIRGTIERSAETHRMRMTPAEIDHAVRVGMELSDGRGGRTWGDIADAGIAAVKARRNR